MKRSPSAMDPVFGTRSQCFPSRSTNKHKDDQTSLTFPPLPCRSCCPALFSFPDQCLHRCLHWRHPLCHLAFALQPTPVWLLSSPLPPSKFSRQRHPKLLIAKCRSRSHLPVLRPYSTTPTLLEKMSSLGFYGMTLLTPSCL